MNNKAEMTMDDLREMLLENEVTNFDPVAEAFKVRDYVVLYSIQKRLRVWINAMSRVSIFEIGSVKRRTLHFAWASE